MLVHSNFQENSKTLIYEETQNVLTSAYAMRTSNKGEVCSLFVKRLQNKNLNIFNLKRKDKYTITHMNLDMLLNPPAIYSSLMKKKYLYSFDK